MGSYGPGEVGFVDEVEEDEGDGVGLYDEGFGAGEIMRLDERLFPLLALRWGVLDLIDRVVDPGFVCQGGNFVCTLSDKRCKRVPR